MIFNTIGWWPVRKNFRVVQWVLIVKIVVGRYGVRRDVDTGQGKSAQFVNKR